MKKLVTFVVVLVMAGAVHVASASPFSDAVNALSPVAYWQFEDNFNDSTANPANLTPRPIYSPGFRASAGLPGLGAKAMDIPFPAIDYYYAYANTSSGNATKLNLTGQKYSINLWVANERTVSQGNWESVVMNCDSLSGGGGAFNYGLDTWLDTGTSGYRTWIEGGLGTMSYTASTGSIWHMLTLSMDLSLPSGDQLNFYIDGQKVYGRTFGVNYLTLAGDGTIFATGFASGQWFQGGIDDLAVFNSPLSANDVVGLYNAASVPEPMTLIVLALGSLLVARRRS